ncbi:mechanosensitive ion channel family protein [Legionella pneumophila]|uniref:mechanosensitive ion channel family protein n=1 Tax=Legionella pneumophila TaxID=446 RepID=UPI00026DA58C|nr:mechanosensitive ion channel domain-containing protein [Legionella pneumophila]MDW9140089.1 mechanosensitive ion channel [Legionella pneumophila]CCD08840.1 Transporter, small conductance mechanosensitive ion channel (MscS) family protein [Legionella pneumophila subsp. pneumophila]CZG03202.1 Potassium efflux system KefA precursor [Legionella pneumophila]CZJ50963.1 Potassium efflux system KefA precursor [Legionella pneumophila]CZR06754.1 Potassium efflux system KefA precursor [Legionella pneu
MAMRIFVMILLFFFSISPTLGDTTLPAIFDVKNANKQFDQINLQLSVQNLNLNNLNKAVETLSELSAQSDECIADIQKKINGVDTLIKQATSTGNDKGADLVYLNNQKHQLAELQSQCRLFSIRAQEAIEAYKSAILQLRQEKTLARTLPLWQLLNKIINSSDNTKWINHTKEKFLLQDSPVYLWFCIVTGSFLISILILSKLRQSNVIRRYVKLKKIRWSHITLLALFMMAGSFYGYISLFTDEEQLINSQFLLIKELFWFLCGTLFIVCLFKVKKIKAFFDWYAMDSEFFEILSIVIVAFYFLALSEQRLFDIWEVNKIIVELTRSIFLFLLLGTTAYFTHYFCRSHLHISFVKRHYNFIRYFIFALLSGCAILNISGFYTLAMQLTLSGIFTFFILYITILIGQSINKFYASLSYSQGKLNVIRIFGYKKDQMLTEFYILKITLKLVIVLLSIYLIGISWGFATDFIDTVYKKLLYGFTLANITIYPTRILFGIVIFCFLYLVSRAISTSISRHQQFENEEETQVAIASILTYVGFSIAVISGLLVAGFNFTGLAIIAGALSVGIGLGLQSIVNNFVSGIILLIEKPIRPGDRINIDGVEGFVKKIRVRSTQIITPVNEDIIIPNSDLITRRVVNYMLTDNYWRVNCEVSVAFGTNLNLVKDILLEIANKHDDVVKSGRNKPVVLFTSFADSALTFQLWCMIKDVNKKSTVKSELNFSIEEAFRKHDISIT